MNWGCPGAPPTRCRELPGRRQQGAAQVVPASREAPPVLVLSSVRVASSPPNRSFYDNHWFVTPGDFPTPERLAEANIEHVLVVSRSSTLAGDLADALAPLAGFDVQVLNLRDGMRSRLPAPKPALWRGLSVFGRELSRRPDGTWGRHFSSHG